MPTFAFTTDIDWASETAIADLLDFLGGRDIPCTAFVTHQSAEIDRAEKEGRVEVGLHPNFLPGSTHGDTVTSVLDHVFSLKPKARCFRSHSMVDSTPISVEMADRGILYDSNLALYLQPGLGALDHWIGTPRFPVFWPDDCHWRRGGTWNFSDYAEQFFTPGLKVISVHPFMFSMNIPNHDFYLQHKHLIPGLDGETMARLRYAGEGVRTFVSDFCDEVRRRGFRFVTLGDVYDQWCAGGFGGRRIDA